MVVTWNSAEEIVGLIESARRLLPGVCDFVFVDNASQDDTVSVIRQLAPESEVVELEDNIGFGPANNIGVREATNDVVILLNPDTVLVDRSLIDLAELARTERALFVPRLLNADGSWQISARPALASLPSALISVWPGPWMPRLLRERCEPWRFDTRLAAGWVSGACLAAQRSLLLEFGPFDERLQLYGEDADLSMRGWKAGVPSISAPDVARVMHVGGRSATRAFDDFGLDRKVRVRWWLVNEHHGPLRGRLDLAAEFLLYGTRWAAKRALLRPAQNEAQWLRVASRMALSRPPSQPPRLPSTTIRATAAHVEPMDGPNQAADG